jgi:hypothetical protein
VVRRNPKLGKQVVQKPVKKPDVQPDPVKQPDVQPNPGDGSNEERMLYRPGEVKGR